MRMRARVFIISIATLLFVILAGATAVPDALAENRSDARRDAHDGHGGYDVRSHDGKLQLQIDALRLQLTAAKASGAWADAALQKQINALKAQLAAMGTPSSGGSLLNVFDGGQKSVGPVFGLDSENIPWVLMTARDTGAQSYTFALKVFRGQLAGANVLFSGPNCTGTAFLEPLAVTQGVYFGPNAISLGGVDYVHGGTVYAAPAGAAVIQVNLGSKAMDDGSCFSGLIGFPGSYVVAATPVTFTTAFTPPYSVR
jgi:hypothetical protein